MKLEKEGYYEARTTPGLWQHKWRTIKFCLIVDDFGVEYIGKQHADHLATTLKKYHNITKDWEGKKYAGIDLKWDYDKRACRATMDGYILELRNKYGHSTPKNHNTRLTSTGLLIMELNRKYFNPQILAHP